MFDIGQLHSTPRDTEACLLLIHSFLAALLDSRLADLAAVSSCGCMNEPVFDPFVYVTAGHLQCPGPPCPSSGHLGIFILFTFVF